MYSSLIRRGFLIPALLSVEPALGSTIGGKEGTEIFCLISYSAKITSMSLVIR